MITYCLPACVDGTGAARRFARPRLRNLFGLFSRTIRVPEPGVPSTRIPPFVERLWMPAYAVCIRTSSAKGDQQIWTSVEGISGTFSLFDGVGDLDSRSIEEEVFPPTLGATEAGDLARAGLVRYIMSQRGQMDKPAVQEIIEVRTYHFPVWVCYFHRYGLRHLDLKVLEACSGRAGGAKLRISVLNALIAARKKKREEWAGSAPRIAGQCQASMEGLPEA